MGILDVQYINCAAQSLTKMLNPLQCTVYFFVCKLDLLPTNWPFYTTFHPK